MILTIDNYRVKIEAARVGCNAFNKEDTLAFLNLLSLCLGRAGTGYPSNDQYKEISTDMSKDIYFILKQLGIYGGD